MDKDESIRRRNPERELWLCYERCFTYLCPSEIINYKFYVAHSLELKPGPEVAAYDDVADDDIKQTSSNGMAVGGERSSAIAITILMFKNNVFKSIPLLSLGHKVAYLLVRIDNWTSNYIIMVISRARSHVPAKLTYRSTIRPHYTQQALKQLSRKPFEFN